MNLSPQPTLTHHRDELPVLWDIYPSRYPGLLNVHLPTSSTLELISQTISPFALLLGLVVPA